MAITIQELREIDRFFAQKQYDRAIELLKKLVEVNPSEVSLKMKLADAYFLYGRNEDAVRILTQVAETYALHGFVTKAMAVQKKIQRIDDRTALTVLHRIQDIMEEGEEEPTSSKAKQQRGPDKRFLALDSLFKGLSREEFEEIFNQLDEQVLDQDATVFVEGDEDNSLFIIVSGEVRVVASHRGKPLELARLGEGDFFGEVALLTGKARTASVYCTEPCTFLVLERKKYLALSKRFPAMQENLATALERRAQSAIETFMKADAGETEA